MAPGYILRMHPRGSIHSYKLPNLPVGLANRTWCPCSLSSSCFSPSSSAALLHPPLLRCSSPSSSARGSGSNLLSSSSRWLQRLRSSFVKTSCDPCCSELAGLPPGALSWTRHRGCSCGRHSSCLQETDMSLFQFLVEWFYIPFPHHQCHDRGAELDKAARLEEVHAEFHLLLHWKAEVYHIPVCTLREKLPK